MKEGEDERPSCRRFEWYGRCYTVTGRYKCGEGGDLYLKFKTDDPVSTLKHGRTIEGQNGMTAGFERIDRRVVKFKMHWFPMHININVVEQYFSRFCTCASWALWLWKREPLEEIWFLRKISTQKFRTGRPFSIDLCLSQSWAGWHSASSVEVLVHSEPPVQTYRSNIQRSMADDIQEAGFGLS